MRRRRGQAVVEVLALAPVLMTLLIALTIAERRLAAAATAEAILADVVAADAAGEPLDGALGGRARLLPGSAEQVAIAVDAPLGAIVRHAERPR